MVPNRQSDRSQEVDSLRQEVVELKRQLIQAQKLSSVGALAASITHEFNNILTTIINYARMGVRHQSNEVRDKAFDKILAASLRAAKITTGMLSYARSGKYKKEAVSLSNLVEDILVLVDKDLQTNRIHVETDLRSDVVAEVNANQIQQVLLNLVVNARQAMQTNGTLTIKVYRDEGESLSEISVTDTGSGIPRDKLPKIFESFYSTKEADEKGQGGTGIGLALCREIIEAHHGRIRVESRVGQGTTFTLKFPAATTSFSKTEANEAPKRFAKTG